MDLNEKSAVMKQGKNSLQLKMPQKNIKLQALLYEIALMEELNIVGKMLMVIY